MKKIQEAIYFNRLDLNELFWAKDKRGLGYISLKDFVQGLKLAPITWNTGDLDEIVEKVPKDPSNNVYYKDFQKSLNSAYAQSAIQQPKQETWEYEKVACALNEYLIQVPHTNITFDDFRIMIRKTWLNIPIQKLHQIWDVIPHDKFTLIQWAKQHSVPVNSFNIPEAIEALEALPKLVTRLKEIALVYGNRLLIEGLKSKDWLNKEEFLRILDKFRIPKDQSELDEFREWAIKKGIMKAVGSELFYNGHVLSLYFTGVDFVEQQKYEADIPIMYQVVQSMLISIIREKLLAIRKCLEPFTNKDYVEEIRLREVLKIILPSLTNENISLFINSLRLTLPPSSTIPFRQINIPEFLNLFDPNNEVTIPMLEKPAEIMNETIRNPENLFIQETFRVRPRDYSWEKQLLRRVFEVKEPLLCNFRLNDWNQSGAMTLETFHYTLGKSLQWLNDEEIYFLVDLAVRECGSIDETRTLLAREQPDRFRVKGSISNAWYPDGEQFNISYLYFLVVIEKLIA